MSHDTDIPIEAMLAALTSDPLEAQRRLVSSYATPEDALDVLIARVAQQTAAGPALELTARLLTLVDSFPWPTPQVRARRARARALCYGSAFDDALEVCAEGIRIATEAGLEIEAGRARLASMHALGELGRLADALATGRAARREFEAADAADLAARADINLGIIHQRREEPSDALACFDRARPVLADEPAMLGYLENNRGEALLAVNAFDQAETAFRAALAIFTSTNAALTAAIAEGNLADLAARRGRLDEALYYFESARRHLEGQNAPAILARLLAEQAEAKAILGMPADAVHEYERALADLDRYGLPLEAARTRSSLGRALARLDQVTEAETALAAAAAAFDEQGRDDSRARVDLARAEIALVHGRVADARRLALRGLAVLERRPADAARARHLLARAHAATGETALARADLDAAVAIAERLDLAPLLADVLTTRARLALDEGRHDEAIADLEASVHHIERVRGSLQAERFRARFLGTHAGTYAALVDARLARRGEGDSAAAFEAAERARCRGFLDELRGRSTDTADVADDTEHALRREHAEAQDELNALYSRLADDARSEGDAWRHSVASLERRLTTVEDRLGAMSGRTFLGRPADLASIQARLGDHETLIEYMADDEGVVIFVVTRDDLRIERRRTGERSIADTIDRFRFQVELALRPGASNPRRAERQRTEAERHLAVLGASLLEPVHDVLEKTQRVTIVPHGALHLVPFAALPVGAHALIDVCEVSSIPSASLFAHLAGLPDAPARPRMIIFGAADEQAPRIEEEARRIAALRPNAMLAVGGDATADRFLAEAPEAGVIHLACHGRFLRGNPFGSGVRFIDRWFTTREISSMNLTAELVTLGACESGVQAIQAGDELIGLLRSFLVAGARSVLASLWPVQDAQTVELMTSLYGSRSTMNEKGTRVAGRLRDAIREVRDAHPHPAHWAPFVLVGRS